MKKIFTLFNIRFLLLLLLAQAAVANAQVTDAQVYQLLDKSGATRIIESLPMQMQAMGQQMGLTAKDPAAHQQEIQMIVSSINTDDMLRTMAENIKANASQEDVSKILTWLGSELGNRLVQAELQSADPQFQQNLMRYMADLQANPPSAERSKTIISFVESSKMVDQAMNMVEGMLQNMFAAAKAKNPDDKVLAANLDNQLAQIVASLKPVLEQQTILSSYYVYRDISVSDMNKYSDFYQQPTGKKYLSLIVDAVGAAMNDWGVVLIDKIAAKEAK